MDPEFLTLVLKDEYGLDSPLPGGIHLARPLIDRILCEQEKAKPTSPGAHDGYAVVPADPATITIPPDPDNSPNHNDVEAFQFDVKPN